MAVQDPLLHLGWMTLSTLDDARRSTITGTTLNGPNGSGQFFPVYLSTVAGANMQVRLGSTAQQGSSLAMYIGILQNTPGPGEAADVGFVGVSKAIAGSTALTPGTLLVPSSAAGQGGELILYSTAAGLGPAIGYALEAPTSTGALFSVLLFPTGTRST